jgi:hypothetical protein
MRTAAPLVLGLVSSIGLIGLAAIPTACTPVAPETSDSPASPNRGTGGSLSPSSIGGGGSYATGGTSGGSSAGGSGGSSGASGVAAFATCSSPADMKGVSAADFCTQYMSTCQFGSGAAKYSSVDDCKTKYGGYTGEQKWCVAYHLCKGAESNGAGKDVHCPHTAGGGGDPCKLAAAATSVDAGTGGGSGGSGGGAPDAGGPPAAAPSLKTDIYPLFMAKCQKCHMDLVKGAADLFPWLMGNAARPACGPMMMPRKAVVLSKTNPDATAVCGGKMPVGSMGDAEIWNKLKAWNTAGAKDN